MGPVIQQYRSGYICRDGAFEASGHTPEEAYNNWCIMRDDYLRSVRNWKIAGCVAALCAVVVLFLTR